MNPIHGLVITDDLLFASRIVATGRAHQLTITQIRNPVTFDHVNQLANVSAVFLDLQWIGAQLPSFVAKTRQANPKCRIVAYGSHVDLKSLELARNCGCDVVLPRSSFAQQVEEKLPEWLMPCA